MKSIFAAAVLGACAQAGLVDAPYFYNADRPLVIGHRGSFGKFPEHSIAGYADCFFGGCDFIELDLQLTKDGNLVANHDPTLAETTDIMEYTNVFGSRELSRFIIDGNVYKNNWQILDFTLAELQVMRRRQRYNFRSTLENDRYAMVGFDEVVGQVNMLNDDFARRVNAATRVGLYIEIKNYDWYLSTHGVDMAEQLYSALQRHGLSTIADCSNKIPIVIQSFSYDGLVRFMELSDLPRVYLMGYNPVSDIAWGDISAIAHGVGPNYQYLFDWTPPADFHHDERPMYRTMSPFVQLAHEHNLAVHPYTFQDDNLQLASTAYDEAEMYVNAGADGLFCEFPHSTYNLFSVFGSKAHFPPTSEAEWTTHSKHFLN